ncbi:MAG: membrane protein insertion efficiency factor YidD [Candidatus Omnitrophica bacterium]|nr:membrane protein insertion efficiency factor YidD [Candidatus Omnitrophota bacterium]
MFKRIAIELINLYRYFVRPFFPASCRFVPSCSQYTRQAIVKYGLFKGALRGIKRLLSCHPFSRKFGDDPLL